MKIDTRRLLPGDIIGWRNSSGTFGILIRAVVGSYTNHDAMFIYKNGEWFIGEAVKPISKLTVLRDYERAADQGNVMRVWRVENATKQERDAVNQYFLDNCLGIKYPLSVLRLWIFRFVNNLPWKIKGKWCTQLVWDAWCHIDPNVFDRPDGKKKLNPTPRTMENRLVAGVIRDITEEVCIH